MEQEALLPHLFHATMIKECVQAYSYSTFKINSEDSSGFRAEVINSTAYVFGGTSSFITKSAWHLFVILLHFDKVI